MNCRICKNKSEEIFSAAILNKYDIKYYQCPKCRFIQTQEPFWLDEAYKEAITDEDTGYVTRNIEMSTMTDYILKFFFLSKKKFLDYGGGYGLFVRMMRDKGYNYYLKDQYCKNIFVKNFEIEELKENTRFELVTAFEVFEHFTNPIEEIAKIFDYSDSILFSTSLQRLKNITKATDWWYFAPEIGQHLSFYSYESLKFIASKFEVYLYSNKRNLHLISKKKFLFNPVKLISYFFYFKKFTFGYFRYRKSLVIPDFEFIKSELLNEDMKP